MLHSLSLSLSHKPTYLQKRLVSIQIKQEIPQKKLISTFKTSLYLSMQHVGGYTYIVKLHQPSVHTTSSARQRMGNTDKRNVIKYPLAGDIRWGRGLFFCRWINFFSFTSSERRRIFSLLFYRYAPTGLSHHSPLKIIRSAVQCYYHH